MYEEFPADPEEFSPFGEYEAGAMAIGTYAGIGAGVVTILSLRAPGNAANKHINSLHANVSYMVNIASHLPATAPASDRAIAKNIIAGQVMQHEREILSAEAHKPQLPGVPTYLEVFSGLPLLGALTLTALTSIVRHGIYNHKQKTATQQAERTYIEEQVQDFRESIDARDRRR